MLITNSSGEKLRFSEYQDVSEDETRETFAHVIADGYSLNIPSADVLVVTIEKEGA